MNRYQIDGETYGTLDNELWMLIQPIADNTILNILATPEPPEEPIRQKAKKRKAGKYNKANPMPEEVKEQIHAKSAAGATTAELAKEFGVSLSSVGKVLSRKPEAQTTKNSDVQDYVCENGHEFRSKLSPGNVMCPTCRSMDCDLGTLNGPVKDDLGN